MRTCGGMREKLLAVIVIPLVPAMSPAHAAQPAFPDKPIRLIIGSAPGSGPDILSRVLGESLYQAWGQRIVVDSRPGVAGIISAELALRANPDGYTWMMLTSQLFVATSVYPDLKFNLDKDFLSIALVGTVPFVQMVNPQVPVKSIPELIALAKKSPGMLRYGSAGTGASEHLSGVMFTRMTGTNMLHVPYKGIAQAIADTMAGEVQLTYAVMPAARPHVDSGRLRAIGVTSGKRAPLLPNVPSISEFVPDYEMLGWYSLVAPIGSPAAILNKVSAEVVKAVKAPEFGERHKALGVEVIGGNRAELDKFRQGQRKRIGEIVKASGVDLK
ncbi:MAG: tripartite tricarboxylate transporter substrate binding protein [Betaproteobacteria bacterium]|nr:tripartite tricarboxylate transporter substrate binding protein [Betaproteobacteria bacterium]